MSLSRLTAPLAGALAGCIAIVSSLGMALIDPTYIEWLLHGDWNLHFLGWHHYRGSGWSWPIGLTPELVWPVGSSIGLTDSIPVAAFVFKPFDALLPPDFQFIGLWLALCFMLQGVIGATLMRLATASPLLQSLGAVLFVLSPPLIFRAVHPALMAHWVVLLSWWLYLDPRLYGHGRRHFVGWAAAVGLAAGIQPYLWLMVMAMMGAAHLRVMVRWPSQWMRVIASAVGVTAWAGVVMWQSGDFIISDGEGLTLIGVDAWSMNGLSLIMPTEGSTLLGRGWFEYAKPGQYEGYAYLGAGMLLLAPIALVGGVIWRRHAITRSSADAVETRRHRMLEHIPMVLALVALTLIALSPVVTMGSRTLFEYDHRWLGPLTTFRSSGRMFWPVYYLVVIAILFGIARLPARVAVIVMLVACAVQTVDLTSAWRTLREARTWGFRDPLADRFWQVVPRHYERLLLVPTNLCSGDRAIEHTAFSLLAGRQRLAINAGITARYDVTKARAYCAALERDLDAGVVDARALYVMQPASRQHFEAAAGARLVCTVVDGFDVCADVTTYSAWQDDFDVLRRTLPALDELRTVHAALDEEYRTTLGRGAQTSALTADERIDALARYMAYRLSGCPHDEATKRTLALGAGEPRLCSNRTAAAALPGSDAVFRFRQQLDQSAQARGAGASAPHHIDAEGEAVWLLDYVARRLAGASADDARAGTLDAVRSAR